jgi:putative ABC transport system ATP-binding protein
MQNLIKIENLCKTYITGEVETRAVSDVSCEIEKGEFVAIMGPSGSGKSTLMQMLGFLDRPTKGKYFFEDKNVVGFSDDELAKIRNEKIGFIFQSFNLLPRKTVFENVVLPLLYIKNKISKKETERRVTEALKAVMLEHRIFHYTNQLSGGEKQRVAIARALVNNPELVFADEPTGNLDSKSGLQIMKILQELNNKGKTIILVTHENYTSKHAKRLLKLQDGMLVSDETIKDRMIADGEEGLMK